jgi:hypothetical protein
MLDKEFRYFLHGTVENERLLGALHHKEWLYGLALLQQVRRQVLALDAANGRGAAAPVEELHSVTPNCENDEMKAPPLTGRVQLMYASLPQKVALLAVVRVFLCRILWSIAGSARKWLMHLCTPKYQKLDRNARLKDSLTQSCAHERLVPVCSNTGCLGG